MQIDINQTTTVEAGPGGAMSGEEQTNISRYAQGIATKVKAEMYCETEVLETPNGPVYTSKVLTYVPHESLEQMKTQLFGE